MKIFLFPVVHKAYLLVGLFALFNSKALGQEVTGFRLIDADTDLPIEAFNPISDGVIIGLAELPTLNLNVQAVTTGTISAIIFGFDSDASFRRESAAPYALCGDGGGAYFTCPGSTFDLGLHSVTATPTNNEEGALTISFTITEESTPAIPSASPSSSPSAAPSVSPSSAPNASPSNQPSGVPSEPGVPSATPSSPPSVSPSNQPSGAPSEPGVPSATPSRSPTASPSSPPSAEPSTLPSASPNASPSTGPSAIPSVSLEPTAAPSDSSMPSSSPSASPTMSETIPLLYFSLSSDRSNPTLLDGQTLSGDVWIFTDLAFTDVAPVTFRIDGVFSRTENGYPYDLRGGGAYNVNQELSDTLHTMTAESFVDGSLVTASATFLVFDPSSVPRLLFSPPTLSFEVFVDGTSPVLSTELTASDDASVIYTIDTQSLPSWLELAPVGGGLTPSSNLVSVFTSGLPSGFTETVVVEAQGPDGGPYVSGALEITIRISGPEDFYEQLHLAWVDDTSTTMNILWVTYEVGVQSVVQYRPVSTSTWSEATGGIRETGTVAGEMHEVALTGLSPATEYEYRVMVKPDYIMLSSIFTFRTSGATEFSAIYVADTGIIGRDSTVGLETTLKNIEDLDPLLLIPGGDYAYYDDEMGSRYPLLDQAIDAWFRMIEPISRGRPIMPTYGNHEDHILETYEDWAKRFPTPEGWANRRSYSFDVNGVHFISIYAVHPNILNPETFAWLENDVITARNDPTVRWIIPYLHMPIFGDGSFHPAATVLRNQVGPLFEQNGVPVVFSAHDQAYERSYALVNIGGGNAVPSSGSTSCYSTQNNDGVVFAKVSPGGRVSDMGGFSTWMTEPAPAWTAYRENTRRHFAEIVFRSDGSILVNTYGVEGGVMGQTTLDDWFEYRTDACPDVPTSAPSVSPSMQPSPAPVPTVSPSSMPSSPTATPSATPSMSPSLSVAPTLITAFTLVNADTDEDIGPLTDGMTINLNGPNLSVRADPVAPFPIGSVRFVLDGDTVRTEGGAPYAIAGDGGGNYYPWNPSLGSHTLVVTAYSEPGAGGMSNEPATVSFTVIDEAGRNLRYRTP